VPAAGNTGDSGGAPAAAGEGGSPVAMGGAGKGSADGGHSNAGHAGASNTGGHTSTGGGGATNTAGAGGKAVEPGNACTSDCPTGQVTMCAGDGCPYGECDNSHFVVFTVCGGGYPNPVNASSVFCAAGSNAGYCMLTTDNDLNYWVVNCVDGTPHVTPCSASCSLNAEGVASC